MKPMTKLYTSEEVNDYFIDNNQKDIQTFGVIVVNFDGNEKVVFSYVEAVEWLNSRN